MLSCLPYRHQSELRLGPGIRLLAGSDSIPFNFSPVPVEERPLDPPPRHRRSFSRDPRGLLPKQSWGWQFCGE